MISDIKSVADFIIQLFSERQKNREHLIKEVVDPLYKKTKEIVDAYRELLSQAVSAINTQKNEELNDCLIKLKKVRDAYITERQSVYAIAEVASDRWNDDELESFAKELMKIFFGDIDGPFYYRMWSFGRNVLGMLDDYGRGEVTKNDLLDSLEVMEDALTNNWETFSGKYARIKIPKT